MRAVWTLAVLAACGGSGDAEGRDKSLPGEDEPAVLELANSLRVDVYPAEIRTSDGSGFRALPQTHIPLNAQARSEIDVGTVDLIPPRVQSGTITGFALNPLVAALPGTQVPVEGTIYIRQPGTVQSYASSIEVGDFETWLVPEDVYQLAIVPDDPLLPMYTQVDLPIGLAPPPLEIDIGLGVPIYGEVRSTSGPVEGALVHVVDADGNVSATATADELGLYQVRVYPGTFTVVCEGREVGQDPTLTETDIEVDDLGANVDFLYPTGLVQVLAEGRVTAAAGGAVPGTLVRFISESLDEFSTVDASWTWDAPTDPQGTFIAKIVPGVYTVELLPPVSESGPDHTPMRLVGQRIGAAGADLGEVELQSTIDVTGVARDEWGSELPGASLDCTEVGFDERSWITVTDEDGNFELDLPRTDLECVLKPPGDRPDLAARRVHYDPRSDAAPALTLGAGTLVIGNVVRLGTPEEFAVTEVRDLDGNLLGFGLTDDEGDFSVRVDTLGPLVLTEE